MTKNFDNSMSEYEQRMGMPPKCHTGRKHMHTLGPGVAKKVDKVASGRKSKKAKKFKNEVSKYFNGERDEYPKELP